MQSIFGRCAMEHGDLRSL